MVILAVAVVIVVPTGMGVLTVVRVSKANSEVAELSTRNVARLTVMGDIRGEQARINDAAANLNAPHTDSFRAGVRQRARRDLARMDGLMAQYQRLVRGTGTERSFARLMAIWRVYRNGMGVYLVKDPPIPGEPLPPGPEKLGEMTVSITEGLDAQADLERAGAAAVAERQQAAYDDTIRQVVGLLVAGLVLTGAVGVLAVRTDAARRRSEVRFRALVQSSSDVISVLDLEGRPTYVSPSAMSIMGYAPESLVGGSYADQVHPEDLDRVNARRESLLSGNDHPDPLEVRVRHADGSWHWHEVVARNLLHDPAVRGIVVNHRDISERHEFLDHLQESNLHLRALTEELESFSSSVAHDLRAPLRAMSGHVEIVIEEHADQLPSDAVRSLNKIKANVVKMDALIDALLSFSRMQRQQMQSQAVDLTRLVHAAWDALAAQRADRDIRFDLEDLPPCQGAPDLLERAMINLLDNAVKFTVDQPTAEIQVGAEPGPDGFTTYFVKDNGTGFDPAYADQLFKPFHRLHSSAEYPGTGIGISIVERIIARHGGRITAESAPGKGARFSFTLPSRAAGTAYPSAEASPQDPGRAQQVEGSAPRR